MAFLRLLNESRFARFLLNTTVFFLASILAIWVWSSSQQISESTRNLPDQSKFEPQQCDTQTPVKRVAIVGLCYMIAISKIMGLNCNQELALRALRLLIILKSSETPVPGSILPYMKDPAMLVEDQPQLMPTVMLLSLLS